MQKSEAQVKKEIESIYILYKRVRWEKICLLILSLVPPGKFVSKIFIHNKVREWCPLNPGKNNLKSIEKALYHLYLKRLIVKEELSTFGKKKLSQLFGENTATKSGAIKLIFRLPTEGEKIKIMVAIGRLPMVLRQNFHKRKSSEKTS